MIRTLFATHYHEMTALEGKLTGMTNLNVDVTEENGNVVFLHKIVKGSASRSYGIHVAKLAGAPKELLERAEERLLELENGKNEVTHRPLHEKAAESDFEAPAMQEVQLSLFESIPDPIITKLRSLDLMDTTPSQALKILEELKEQL